VALAAAAVPAAGCAIATTSSSTGAPAGRSSVSRGAHPDQRAVVDHVVDGDTLDVRIGARFTRVRTVQIDAPESSATRYGHADRCGAPAKRYAESLTGPGRTVTLQFAGRDYRDSYGRLLAIVHLGGPRATTWQQRMVGAGWAEVLVYRGNATPLLGTLRADAAHAKARRLGVWARCAGHFHDPGDQPR
jgi:endonuclease YncB( thermonuclease family)